MTKLRSKLLRGSNTPADGPCGQLRLPLAYVVGGRAEALQAGLCPHPSLRQKQVGQ